MTLSHHTHSLPPEALPPFTKEDVPAPSGSTPIPAMTNDQRHRLTDSLLAPPSLPLSCWCINQGHGIYIDKCKNRYEGGWRNDRAQGYGSKVFSKGDRHEGMYGEDKRNGWGESS